MAINRRQFLATSAAALGAMQLPRMAFAAEDIKLGSLLDISGSFDIYGKPMNMATDLAIEQINAAGGLIGRKVKKIGYDTQSKIALYTKFAQELVRVDHVDVVHGGILSASREAIRPYLHRENVLYFYNVLYEGGVCDRNIVCDGVTPAQQIEVLIPYVMKRWGKKAYILAADYNYGQITAKWLQYYLRKNGGEAVAVEFFPLDVSDFNSAISKIQVAKPDFIISALVGGAHMSFYRQWAAAGMNQKIPMASTTMGVGNEHKVLTPKEGNGIVVAYNYAPTLDIPSNEAFLAAWKKKYGSIELIHEIAVSQYQGIKLWAAAVERAKSVKHAPMVKAIESHISIEGPAGKVTIDPQTHHAILDVHIMEVHNHQLIVKKTFKQRQPVDTQRVCNLQKHPNSDIQYEIKL